MYLLETSMIVITITFNNKIKKVEESSTLLELVFCSAIILLIEIGRERDAMVIKRE